MQDLTGSNLHYFYYDAEFFLTSVQKNKWNEMEFYLGTPHIFIDSYVTDVFDDLAARASDLGICIRSVHPETLSFRYSLCRLEKEWHEKSIACYKNCLDFARERKIRELHTNLTGAFRDDPKEQVLRAAADAILELLEYEKQKSLETGEAPVTICLETEEEQMEGFLCSISELKQLEAQIERISSLQFAVGINWEAMTAARETMEQWLNAFPGRVRYVRCQDSRNLPELKRACERLKFAGSIIFSPGDDESLAKPDAADAKAAEKWRQS